MYRDSLHTDRRIGGVEWFERNIILPFSSNLTQGCSSCTRPSGKAASHINRRISMGRFMNLWKRFVSLLVIATWNLQIDWLGFSRRVRLREGDSSMAGVRRTDE